jgi:hypothetical protein
MELLSRKLRQPNYLTSKECGSTRIYIIQQKKIILSNKILAIGNFLFFNLKTIRTCKSQSDEEL